MQPKKVFCSHRVVDKPAVEEFARRLREAGIDAQFDAWEVSAGDDIVAWMNKSLDECEVGLVFFSSEPWAGRWFDTEVNALTSLRVELGRRLIPVIIDAKANVPPLLRPLSRRSIDDFQQIVDAINGVTRKPPLGPTRTLVRTIDFTIKLDNRDATTGKFDITALRDGTLVARQTSASLPRPSLLLPSPRQFRGEVKDATRGPAALVQQWQSASSHGLVQLGQQLGAFFYAGDVGQALRQALAEVNTTCRLDLGIESADAVLLSLPFEAAPLDGRLPALQPGVAVRRVVSSVRKSEYAVAAPHPLKILVAVGAPDEGLSPNAVLNLEGELQCILDAVDLALEGNAQVRFLEVGHPEQIREALARDEYHVLHLSGHGGGGLIELEDEDGNPVHVTARQLAQVLVSAGRSVPLIFLSSCQGGAVSATNGSMAIDLVREGIPFVLAMQAEVTDAYASALAGKFYAELTKKLEGTDAAQALAHARQQMEVERQAALKQKAGGGGQAAGTPDELTYPEYATATLFCAIGTSPLIDYSSEAQPLKAAPVHYAAGPLPRLSMEDLVGRRAELRQVLRVLRNHPQSLANVGDKAGVVLTGIGGAGKSAVAARAMARLSEDGWVVAPTVGVFSIGGIAAALGAALHHHPHPQPRWALHAADLRNPQLPDESRLFAIHTLLQSERVLLVFDNFEDNLVTGGAAFKDDSVKALIVDFAKNAKAGKLLFTSRYRLPDLAFDFDHQALPPLSAAQVRKLMRRLDMLKALTHTELSDVMRHIGGHPRMLEFLNGILSRGKVKVRDVHERLQRHAEREGIDLEDGVDTLGDAMRTTVLLGARDVLLDELLALARADGDEELLLQCAVSNLPIDAAGVAHALADMPPTPAAMKEARRGLKRLAGLSLVVVLGADSYWVHRWTAEALVGSAEPSAHRQRCTRAARYRLSQDASGAVSFEDAHEATINYLDAQAFDEASVLASRLAKWLVGAQQSIAAATFASGVLRRITREAEAWSTLVVVEASSHLALGDTARALKGYLGLVEAHESRASREPGRADYQRDLSVSYERLGDLMSALGQGEEARRLIEQSLQIGQRLAEAEPGRADYQRDLWASYIKFGEHLGAAGESVQAIRSMEDALRIFQGIADQNDGDQRALSAQCDTLGDLHSAQGNSEPARQLFEQSLQIHQQLANAEPERADRQRDLAASHNKIGERCAAMGDVAQAVGSIETALCIFQIIAEPNDDDQRALFALYDRLGDLHSAQGSNERAREFFAHALAVSQSLEAMAPDHIEHQRELCVAYLKLGDELRNLAQGDQARLQFEQSVRIATELAAAEPTRADLQDGLAISVERLGDLLNATGHSKQAHQLLDQALQIRMQLAEADPEQAGHQVSIANLTVQLGELSRTLGRGEHARRFFDQALQVSRQLMAADPEYHDYQRLVSGAYGGLGTVVAEWAPGEQALPWLEQSLRIAEGLVAADPERVDIQHDLFVALARLGELKKDNGETEQAGGLFERCHRIMRGLAEGESDNVGVQLQLSYSLRKQGEVFATLGESAQSRQVFDEALEIAQRLANAESCDIDYRRNLCDAFDGLAHCEGTDAGTLLHRSAAVRESLLLAQPERADLCVELARTCIQWAKALGKTGQAQSQRANSLLCSLQAEGRLAPLEFKWLDEAKAALANARS